MPHEEHGKIGFDRGEVVKVKGRYIKVEFDDNPAPKWGLLTHAVLWLALAVAMVWALRMSGVL